MPQIKHYPFLAPYAMIPAGSMTLRVALLAPGSRKAQSGKRKAQKILTLPYALCSLRPAFLRQENPGVGFKPQAGEH
jgi:hypothetical protein